MVRTAQRRKPTRLRLIAGRDVERGAADRLCDLVDRIEELIDVRSELRREIEQIYEEAWNGGFNIRVLRRVVLMRQRAKREIRLRGGAALPQPEAVRTRAVQRNPTRAAVIVK